jgi:hypothetical protein
MLSLKQVTDVCMRYQGAQECRYLKVDLASGGCLCHKQVAASKKVIDEQVQKFVDKAKANGQDPYAMHRPLGNHCKGYPPLKTVTQGYDQP